MSKYGPVELPLRTIEDDLVRQDQQITELTKRAIEAERTIAVLVAAGHVAQEKVDKAFALVRRVMS